MGNTEKESLIEECFRYRIYVWGMDKYFAVFLLVLGSYGPWLAFNKELV